MASTTFIDGQTVIYASWLNDVNNAVYNGTFPNGSISLTNLNVSGTVTGAGFSSVVNSNLLTPGPIGSITPNTGAFTTLNATSFLTLNGVAVDTVSGTQTLTNKTLTTPIIGTIKSTATSTPTVFQDSAGTEVGKLARAWVNFVGDSSTAINASFNVSSVTYISTGRYSVNFTKPLADANYAYAGSCAPSTGDYAFWVQTGLQSIYGTNTSSTCYLAVGNSVTVYPTAFVNVVFFR